MYTDREQAQLPWNANGDKIENKMHFPQNAIQVA